MVLNICMTVTNIIVVRSMCRGFCNLHSAVEKWQNLFCGLFLIFPTVEAFMMRISWRGKKEISELLNIKMGSGLLLMKTRAISPVRWQSDLFHLLFIFCCSGPIFRDSITAACLTRFDQNHSDWLPFCDPYNSADVNLPTLSHRQPLTGVLSPNWDGTQLCLEMQMNWLMSLFFFFFCFALRANILTFLKWELCGGNESNLIHNSSSVCV